MSNLSLGSVVAEHAIYVGSRVRTPETTPLQPDAIDQPRYFGAYLHALKWSSVTATDARRFQAPFRTGVLRMKRKALCLPRANLFIADDIGAEIGPLRGVVET